jgi:hypothetical protein
VLEWQGGGLLQWKGQGLRDSEKMERQKSGGGDEQPWLEVVKLQVELGREQRT